MAEYVFNEILMPYPIPLQSKTTIAGVISAISPLIYSIMVVSFEILQFFAKIGHLSFKL
jgi:hypothetical protein